MHSVRMISWRLPLSYAIYVGYPRQAILPEGRLEQIMQHDETALDSQLTQC